MIKTGIILAMIGMLVLVTGQVSFAQEASPVVKFSNGLLNVLTGWMEVPKQAKASYDADGNIFGALTIGTLKGAMYGAGRTIAGAVDTIFFFIEPYDEPLVEPLYDIFK